MKDFLLNILGLLLIPILAVIFVVISPILLLIMFIKYHENDEVKK
jgi:hypothetical protein